MLNEAYKILLLQYAEICTMYEADCKKSKHSKHMLAIPPFNKLTLLQGLQAGDLLLLKGPKNIFHSLLNLLIKIQLLGT